jgi:hypothetical protein
MFDKPLIVQMEGGAPKFPTPTRRFVLTIAALLGLMQK